MFKCRANIVRQRVHTTATVFPFKNTLRKNHLIVVGTQEIFGVCDVNGDATDASASESDIPA